MAGEVSPFRQLEIVVRQANQVEDSLAVAPMEPSRMHVSMHQTMVVHMCHCTRNLSKDKQKPRRRELHLAELLPQTDVRRAVCPEQQGRPLTNDREPLLHVEQVRVRWHRTELVRRLERFLMPTLVKLAQVDECQQAQPAAVRVELDAYLAVELLRVENVDEHRAWPISASIERHERALITALASSIHGLLGE